MITIAMIDTRADDAPTKRPKGREAYVRLMEQSTESDAF
jgi:hypothetical protein